MSELKPCPSCLDDSSATRWAYIADNGATYSEKINYCPKCGRALTDKATRAQLANDLLTLRLGDGKHFIADSSYSDINHVGICAYRRNQDDGKIGVSDIGSKGRTTEDVGAELCIEFTNSESIDVVISALERAKNAYRRPPERSDP